ncbi:OmpA family protein [Hymenobacter canadensis]|uniref:OmpA family protein n=1 Tax=Hymenobacter canadensis TaxID=2999067 RepID=A0ABY7LVF0_9BACT|nr:OmpA family protein [Hymenobacter canadensis]WBA42878.1 OmpA family protein [Hymenobacter canadensis]
MKRSFWLVVLALLSLASAQAQSLTGEWQGVETDTGEPGAVWPAVLRLQKSSGTNVFGVLYQEVGAEPGVSVTFQMAGTRTAGGLRLEHVRKLTETGRTTFSYWCEGAISFTYDPALEKLTGRATYAPRGDCDTGTLTFYRIRLKSAATVPAGVETTLRVSGRNVLWYTDASLKQPVATGNVYRTTLTKATTFYLRQSYYPTRQSTAVPITIQVTGTPPAGPVAKVAPLAPRPLAAILPDTARPVPGTTAAPIVPAPMVTAAPMVLPTVLFRLGTAELLPEALPALLQLAAELLQRPTLRLRVAGHTDRIGEPQKNQILSEQRAEAVQQRLVQLGVAAARISTIGYGDARPLYPSPDARNRRVEVSAEAE